MNEFFKDSQHELRSFTFEENDLWFALDDVLKALELDETAIKTL